MRPVIAFCFWCKLRHLNPVPVSIIETGSGAGGTLYACRLCLDEYGIVPLAEHPKDTDGSIRHRETSSA